MHYYEKGYCWQCRRTRASRWERAGGNGLLPAHLSVRQRYTQAAIALFLVVMYTHHYEVQMKIQVGKMSSIKCNCSPQEPFDCLGAKHFVPPVTPLYDYSFKPLWFCNRCCCFIPIFLCTIFIQLFYLLSQIAGFPYVSFHEVDIPFCW
jgi:hypothetical protein